MIRISGVDLPHNKRIEIGLTKIYGIGVQKSREILQKTGVNPDTRVKDLNESEISKLRDYIEHNLCIEGDLRNNINLAIKRLVEIKCYRGLRHKNHLPVRGQNTKTNSRTRKGPRKAVIKMKNPKAKKGIV